MTQKKLRNKFAKALRNTFELSFLESHRIVKLYSKEYSLDINTKLDVFFPALVNKGLLKVQKTEYMDNSWCNDGYSDNDIITHTLIDNKGNEYEISDYVPGIRGLDWDKDFLS